MTKRVGKGEVSKTEMIKWVRDAISYFPAGRWTLTGHHSGQAIRAATIRLIRASKEGKP